jgi:cytoskeletal protein RodZ
VSSYNELGRFLSQQRQLRGLSRDDVARSTKISPALLVALEEGQRERLPDSVFLQNMIRAYATTIGVSADDAVGRWHEIPGVSAEPPPTPEELEVLRRKNAWKGVLLAVVAVGAALYGLAHWAGKI